MAIDINHLPKLVENLTSDKEKDATEGLYVRANALLEETGQKKTVNGVPAVVSESSCEIRFGGSLQYAYIARYADKKSKKSDEQLPIYLVIGKESGENIESTNPTLLSINTFGQDSTVRFNQGIDPDIENSDYEKLAADIVDRIARYEMEEMKPRREWRAELKRRRIKKRITLGAIGATILAGHLPFVYGSGNQPDAELLGLPMPAPVELFVDFNNHIDHVAQGFSEPEGALPIEIGQEITSIPTLAGYDTREVPDASFITAEPAYVGDESRPSLYESDFHFNNRMSNGLVPAGFIQENAWFDGACYTVHGDYTSGKTRVFSQDPTINEHVTLSVRDADTLAVCKKDSDELDYGSSIYLWQAEE